MMNSLSPISPSPMPFVLAAPDDAPAAANGSAVFAKTLDQAVQAADRHAERPQDHVVRDDSEAGTPGAAARAARGKRLPRTPAAPPREGAAPPAKGPAEDVLPQAESKAAHQTHDDTQSDVAAQALLDLAGLMAGLTQATPRGTATTVDATHGGPQDDPATAASRTLAQQRSGKAAAQAEMAMTQGQDFLAAASQGTESRSLAPGDAVAAAAVLRDSGAARQVFDNAVGSPPAQTAGAAPPAAPPTPAGEPAGKFQAKLAAAPGTPDFASALGTQVSMLIRDGVSQAQLHLNPADMGPIAVHVRLDGDNAQVRDSGAARQVFDNAVGSPPAQTAGAAPPAAPPTPVGEPAGSFQAELAAALGTPEFASALGTQVSVLIRDGVSQAQLHLNPADLGPIAVHIRLDGDNAQVDFSALQALTRQALEDAVPALASALRESGLTLSGGGVFEHARQPQGERQRSRAASTDLASGGASDTVPAPGAAARAFRARGVVDLYA